MLNRCTTYIDYTIFTGIIAKTINVKETPIRCDMIVVAALAQPRVVPDLSRSHHEDLIKKARATASHAV